MLRQFRPVNAGSLHEQWLGHKQLGGVAEYRKKFIELLSPLTGISEEIAKGQFLNGLQENIKAEVRLLGPSNLDMTMDLAQKVEAKLQWAAMGRPNSTNSRAFNHNNNSQNTTYTKQPTQNYFQTNQPTFNPRPNFTYSQTSSYPSPARKSYQPPTATPTASRNSTARSTGEIRRLYNQEMQYRREKGLCFRCDDK